ncbi:MAG: nucleotidyltransferase domain-containing protein [Armatimonadota bacterium]|nr:nucleotidyltransferase domain-containing protein [Armatimonadota bacterium]MDR7440106.1 nucleotidyltransferase domain-containing protein [Armatimonadota bacterium]MDR7563846.1 nucleotidyltransferase domain-containing protein [Armatimonadota bacterium]MDR7567058.1 nucleotidyltransferase domain-containing protein [Armatimonadota bacterium]MDR7601523.1 nucleotidyltransferase domain-containing protein [Armatimonadota bacterium]
MRGREGVDSETLERLRAYFSRQEPVLAAFGFGSFFAGRACRESDVDVAVVLGPAYPGEVDPFALRVRLASDLVGILHRNEVDVLVLNEAPPLLAARVLREGVRIYCRQEAALREFLRDTLLRAADLAPFLARHERTLLRILAHELSRGAD